MHIRISRCHLPYTYLLTFALLQVTYLSEGELESMRSIINWIRFLGVLIKDRHPSLYSEISAEADLVCSMGIKDKIWETLAYKRFQPWNTAKTRVHQEYFMQLNALESLIVLYSNFVSEPWRTMHMRLKVLERGFCLAIANLASNEEFCREVIKLDGVGMCLQSFMRVPLRRGMPATDNSGSPGRPETNDFLVKELITSALEVFRR